LPARSRSLPGDPDRGHGGREQPGAAPAHPGADDDGRQGKGIDADARLDGEELAEEQGDRREHAGEQVPSESMARCADQARDLLLPAVHYRSGGLPA
jgi:hypothetical protein